MNKFVLNGTEYSITQYAIDNLGMLYEVGTEASGYVSALIDRVPVSSSPNVTATASTTATGPSPVGFGSLAHARAFCEARATSELHWFRA